MPEKIIFPNQPCLCDLHVQVYMSSSQLNSDAIVCFVKSLASISLDELRDPRAPRVFSLTKIVEISHFNMSRIRSDSRV